MPSHRAPRDDITPSTPSTPAASAFAPFHRATLQHANTRLHFSRATSATIFFIFFTFLGLYDTTVRLLCRPDHTHTHKIQKVVPVPSRIYIVFKPPRMRSITTHKKTLRGAVGRTADPSRLPIRPRRHFTHTFNFIGAFIARVVRARPRHRSRRRIRVRRRSVRAGSKHTARADVTTRMGEITSFFSCESSAAPRRVRSVARWSSHARGAVDARGVAVIFFLCIARDRVGRICVASRANRVRATFNHRPVEGWVYPLARARRRSKTNA